MEEVEDEPLFCDRVAGIDIGKAVVMVTIRVPSESRKGGRQQETREFGTTRRELLALTDWLRCWQVERAGMESTSDYWKPVFFLLEREGFDCLLYQASQVKALPRRPKTDKLDSVWLAKITEQGSLAGSFVPPEEIRRLRTHTRYRRKLVQMRTAQKERCEKLLEDGHLKLSSVISDIHGVSGRDMLRAIAAGERDPKVLADKARGVMRGKIRKLEEALDCSFFTGEHAFILQMMLDSIDQLTAQITVLDQKIAEMCRPYERQIEQLDGITGFGITTAQDLIGEIGTDMRGISCRDQLVPAAPGRRGEGLQDSTDLYRGGAVVRRCPPAPGDRPHQLGRGRQAGHPAVDCAAAGPVQQRVRQQPVPCPPAVLQVAGRRGRDPRPHGRAEAARRPRQARPGLRRRGPATAGARLRGPRVRGAPRRRPDRRVPGDRDPPLGAGRNPVRR